MFLLDRNFQALPRTNAIPPFPLSSSVELVQIRMKQRFPALDGLRGIAIMLVSLYHAYVRWPALTPYGDKFAAVPVIAQGKVGVQLFFMISGFVIFMSLDQSKSFGSFMKRRWLRLWPAMLVASVFLFATAPLLTRPQGSPSLRDLLPGLSFVEPRWWTFILGSPQGILEGAFWTLFVEMKFYVFVGLLYFVGGARLALGALLFVYLTPYGLGRVQPIAPYLFKVADFLSSWHWGWFAAGAIYYRSMSRRILLAPALVVSIFAASRMAHAEIPMAVVVALLFGAALMSKNMQRLLSSRVFLFLGMISYPLYLIHENLMLSLIRTVGLQAPWMPFVLMPVLPILSVVFLGWVIARFAEPPARKALASLIKADVSVKSAV